MVPSVRFGIVGAGLAAQTHARELGAVRGAVLQAVHARDGGKARRFAAAHGAARAYDDLGRFLADPEIDAVIVATPNGLHIEPALAVAAAGKHLVVEKPLEITLDRARRIVEACDAASVRLFVIYQMRFAAATRQAKADFEAGRLGRLVLVNVLDNEFRPPAYYARDAWRGTREFEGGGCLITQTSHLLDLVQHVAGPVETVFAFAATAFHSIETEDAAVAVLRFRNGALGTISSSTAACPSHRHMVTLAGTKGSITFNGEHDQVLFRAVEGEARTDVPAAFSFADPDDPRVYPTDGQRRQLQAITDALAADASSSGPPEDHLRSVRLMDALYLSVAEGREVRLSELG